MDRRTGLLTALAVALAALLAHGASLWNGFVYDDHRFVERNAAIASLSHPERFFADASTASAGGGIEPDVWRPLRTCLFAVDRALFGLSPAGWHGASLVLHAANAVLVWLLLLRLLSRGGPRGEGVARAAGERGDRGGTRAGRANLFAALFAVLFAVHPSTSESVAWVSSRGDLLAWTLVLLSFEVLAKPGTARTALGCALVALACLAKESAVVAFLLLPLRDLALPPGSAPSRRETAFRTAALAAVTGLYLLARNAVLPGAADLPAFAQIDFPQGGRLAALRGMLASVAWYARVLLWPLGFPFDRNVLTDPVPDSWGDPSVVLGAAILLSLVLVGARAALRRDGIVAFAAFGSLVAMVPVSNVIVPLKAYAAERFLYPALPCLAAGVAAFAMRLSSRVPRRGRRGIALAAAALAVVLGALAFPRDRAWADDETLWTAVRRENPMNPRAHEGLGFEYLKAGRVREAEARFRTYREFQPFDGKVNAELADTFWRVALALSNLPVDDPRAAALRGNRRFALEQTMLSCKAAVVSWTRRGLARGRGSTELLRRTLALDREAALMAGDLREARQANAMLASESANRTGKQAYSERRMNGILAALALDRRFAPSEASKSVEWERVRATLLRDAGADPTRSDPEAAAAVAATLQGLLSEAPDDEGVARNLYRVLALQASALDGEEQRGVLLRVREVLLDLVRRRPLDAELRSDLENTERALGPR